MKKTFFQIPLLILILIFMSCTSQTSTQQQTSEVISLYEKGSYGYDLDFLKSNVEFIHELTNESGGRLVVVPQWQGRVMTSTSNGMTGGSYGWINYDFINAGQNIDQFNPYGGEERFWLGPEGGPFSLYFKKDEKQEFSNWKVPEVLDTKPFQVKQKNDEFIVLEKGFSLENASGNQLDIGVTRTVKILKNDQIWESLETSNLSTHLKSISFESRNTIANSGDQSWSADYGFVSIWLLSMFNPSDAGVVFTRLKDGSANNSMAVKDDYFGKVPADRLKVIDGIVFFKVDGHYRSKIGISPQVAGDYVGGYDPVQKTLTLVWYEKPVKESPYVNSQWGDQDDPLKGDAINSYNDGPNESGEIMGPFYEIESSSPAALLLPGDSLTHVQRVYHFQGEERHLETITKKVFDLSLEQIKSGLP